MADDKDERFNIKTASDGPPSPLDHESSAESGAAQSEAAAVAADAVEPASNIEPTAASEAAPIGPAAPETPKPRAPSRAPALAGGIVLGALIGVGGALGLRYMDTSGSADVEARVADLNARADSIELKTENSIAALAALGSRVDATENAASKSAAATNSALSGLQEALVARPAAMADTPQSSVAPAPDLGPLNARTDAIEQKLGSLEAAVASSASAKQSAPPPSPDLGPLKARTDEMEKKLATFAAALAASQSEIRAQQDREKASAAQQSSLVQSAAQSATQSTAIVAESVRQKLERGAPFSSEFAALENLGVEPAKLAPLRAVAKTGVASIGKLADQFEAESAAILAGEPAKDDASFIDRLTHDAANLVRVRRPGAADGSDVESLVTQIQSALARFDVGRAYVLWTQLPGPAQAKSASWGEAAKARLDALSAAAAIESDAVAALGKSKS
ncbi:MAG: hypothetical protein WDN46_23870 [Methylocella sp.]